MKKWRPLYAANAGGGEPSTTVAGQGGTSPEGTALPTLEGLLADETTRGLIAQYVAEQQAQWQQDAEAAEPPEEPARPLAARAAEKPARPQPDRAAHHRRERRCRRWRGCSRMRRPGV